MTGKPIMFAVALFACMPATAFAQTFAIDQGSFMLGGALSFTSRGGELYEDNNEDRLNALSLNPTLQFFLRRGIAVGGTILVSRTWQGDFSQSTFGIGPRISAFFGTPTLNAYPFLSLSPIYVSNTTDFGTGDISGSGFGVHLTGGAALMVARNVSVTIGLFYLYESNSFDELDDSFTGNTFGIEMGIAAFIF
ncbi:MAG: hypothetical protein ACE5G0_22230 [Rhodothermales bacterium]